MTWKENLFVFTVAVLTASGFIIMIFDFEYFWIGLSMFLLGIVVFKVFIDTFDGFVAHDSQGKPIKNKMCWKKKLRKFLGVTALEDFQLPTMAFDLEKGLENMKTNVQHECIDEQCRTIIVLDKNRDGVRCPRCEGRVIARPFRPKQDSKHKLLTIELDSYNSVPKVMYKGEEITGKVSVSFDWKTNDHQEIHMTNFTIEHYERNKEDFPALKTIMYGDPNKQNEKQIVNTFKERVAALNLWIEEMNDLKHTNEKLFQELTKIGPQESNVARYKSKLNLNAKINFDTEQFRKEIADTLKTMAEELS